jgi:hypothetical protein
VSPLLDRAARVSWAAASIPLGRFLEPEGDVLVSDEAPFDGWALDRRAFVLALADETTFEVGIADPRVGSGG